MFRVEWLRSALNELATIWIAADSKSRQTINAAVQATDQHLQTNPQQHGESRAHGKRILFARPLGIEFEIDSQHRVVTILHVWRLSKRR